MGARSLIIACSLFASLVGTACSDKCNHLGCFNSGDGLSVVFNSPLREPGDYEFELELEGAPKVICSVRLAADTKANDTSCNQEAAWVRLEYEADRDGGPSVVDVTMTAVTGVLSFGTAGKSAPTVIRVKRNGALLAEQASPQVTMVDTEPDACEPCLTGVVRLSVP